MKKFLLCTMCIVPMAFGCQKNQQSVSPESGTPVAKGAGVPELIIGGATMSGYVTNGKWDGQATSCGTGTGLYYLDYVINTDNNSDANNYWTITANNFSFGAAQGTGSVTTSATGVSLQVISWSNTQIKVRPIASYQLDSKPGMTVTVTNSSAQACSKTIDVIGMLGNGRGFGQCTWEAAYQRKLLGLGIPSPGAYATTGNIDANYIPQKGDVVHWSQSHTAFVLTVPTRTATYSRVVIGGVTYDSLVTYSFTLRERNYACNEVAGSSTKTFSKRKNSAGTQILINTGINSMAGSLNYATAYWR